MRRTAVHAAKDFPGTNYDSIMRYAVRDGMELILGETKRPGLSGVRIYFSRDQGR